jgi:ABC-type Mn2+/Zn2+ transport system permease subunit
MSELGALIGDHTVQTVVLGAAILGVVSGVLGSFAVLRRQSLLGDALSHAALPGSASASWSPAPATSARSWLGAS